MEKLKYKDIVDKPIIIEKINRAFHDIDATFYIQKHPEIYVAEKKSWQLIADRVINELKKFKSDLVILDVGTGAGFVIESIEHILDSHDRVIFSDISENMLDLCKNKFGLKTYKSEFLLTDSKKFLLADESIDVITMNSVLHHLPEYKFFIRECSRLLKPGGFLIIKHEPNKRFANTLILNGVYTLLIKMRNSLNSLKRRDNKRKGNNYKQVTKLLLERDRIDCTELSESEIEAIIDIQSPTAGGGIDKVRGFDPYEIASSLRDTFSVYRISTYGFMAKINDSSTVFRRALRFCLKTIYPKNGYFFDLILKKYE